MLQIDVGQVEVYTFHQQIGSYQHFLIGVGEYGTVIAYTILRAFVFDFYIFGETVNQAEFTEFCNFHSNFFLSFHA